MDYINSDNTVSVAGERGFIDCEPNVDGTRVSAAWLNGIQFELLKVIEEAGLTPSGFDENNPDTYCQLLDAINQISGVESIQNIIESAGLTFDANDLNQLSRALTVHTSGADYYIDSGSENNYQVEVSGDFIAPDEVFDGMRIRFIPQNTNTGASTVELAGIGPFSIFGSDGVAIDSGELTAGVSHELTYNESTSAFVLQSSEAPIPLDRLVVVDDVASLRAEIAVEGSVYEVLGHTVSGVGGGQFILDPSDTTSADDNGLVVVTASGQRLKRQDALIVCPTMFGAIPTTTAGFSAFDSTSQIQAAHDTGRHICYSAGDYLITRAINLHRGATVSAEGAPSSVRFRAVNGVNLVHIQNDEVDGGIFWYVGDSSTSQTGSPKINGISMRADFPIRYNDKTGDVSNGGPQPFMMKPHVTNCSIRSRVTGVGMGIDMTKGFDAIITGNEIANFDINIILTGCDLNVISHNRSINASSYHILEYATNTFGSQNQIEHNDILSIGATGTMIKTNSRHVRIFNNYLEQPQARPTLEGFIDISETGMPSIFGSNSANVPLTVEVRDNRIDGMESATSFVYKLNPTGVSHRIYDTGTTGLPVINRDIGLVIEGDYLPVRFNPNHPFINYDFFGEQFGRWNGFKTGKQNQQGLDFVIDNLSYSSLFRNSASINNSADSLRLDSNEIVMLPSHQSTLGHLIPNPVDGNENVNFLAGETYTVTFTARTDSPSGDTLRIGSTLNGASQGLVDMILNEQYTTQSISIAGGAITDTIAPAINRSTANGNIKIKSIVIS